MLCISGNLKILFMSLKKTGKEAIMKKSIFISFLILVFILVTFFLPANLIFADNNGFDKFGYNYKARIFVGPADGVDRVLDGAVWGDPTYANDKLVMKWNAEWDRGNNENWTKPPYKAWEDNEWNGAVPGGSGEVWHYKIIWVGPELKNSPYWVEGGYAIWDQFEVIMDQGTADSEHAWYTHAIPSGYGVYHN